MINRPLFFIHKEGSLMTAFQNTKFISTFQQSRLVFFLL